ncbi:hypothetical protein ACJRPK_14020 [Aquimarina sp. 2-A2]|uniref:hypothetical protein n=1 Tax=Aquimarina sp. 2-A2 TaxID=3382644 RepID=UPI00387F2014
MKPEEKNIKKTANWNALKKVSVQGKEVEVLLFLDSTEEHGEHIKIQGMLNEFFLTDIVIAGQNKDRDFMYSLIQNFPIKTLKYRIEQLAYDAGAVW